MVARTRVYNQFGGFSAVAAAKTGVTVYRGAKKAAAFAKKHRLLTRATNIVRRVAPKRQKRFRAKHPRIARGLKKLRQRGYGNVGLGRTNGIAIMTINRQPTSSNYPYIGRPQRCYRVDFGGGTNPAALTVNFPGGFAPTRFRVVQACLFQDPAAIAPGILDSSYLVRTDMVAAPGALILTLNTEYPDNPMKYWRQFNDAGAPPATNVFTFWLWEQVANALAAPDAAVSAILSLLIEFSE